LDSNKFKSEVETLEKFFSLYCLDNHHKRESREYSIKYNELFLEYKISLCKECHNLLSYALQRLRECPHEEKPRCRKCPAPCYDKEQWRAVGKLMRYSGIQFGLVKVKSILGLTK